MPVEGTPERVTLWATGGRVLMRPQVAGGGEGKIPNGVLGGNSDFPEIL